MNLEELKKLLGEQPELFKGLLGHIATTTEGKELLENYATTKVDKAIGEKISEIYNGIDKDIKDILGLEKSGDKKTYDFVKDLITELKDLKAKKGEAGGSTDPDTAKKIEQLETQLDDIKKANWEGKYNALVVETSTKVEGLTNEITKLQEGNTESLVNVELATGLSSLQFNPNIPKEATDAMTQAVKNKVIKNAKVVEGKVVYYKEDGTPYLNELFKPATAQEIFSMELKPIISGKNVAGGGAEGEKGKVIISGEGDSASKKVILDPSKFNTKLTFATHIEEVLLENGVEKNSTEWHSITAEARKEYAVDTMERV